jgi:hypothetical protein
VWPESPLRSELRLLLQPRVRQAARLAGADVLVLESGHAVSPRMRVAWNDGGWRGALVAEVDGDRIRLEGADLPATGSDLYPMAESRAQGLDDRGSPEYWTVLPHADNRKSGSPVFDSALDAISGGAAIQDYTAGGSTVYYQYLEGSAHAVVYYVPATDAVARVAETAPDDLVLDGKPNLGTSGWALLETDGASQAAAILAQAAGADSLELVTDPAASGVAVLYGDFALELRPADHDVNRAPVFDPIAQDEASSTLPLDLQALPELLKPGRRLLVVGQGDARAVTVKSVDKGARSVTVTPALPGGEDGGAGAFWRHATTIYANVVEAGHGEGKPERVLGGGDATRSNQSFHLDVAKIAQVSDPAFPSGVRADLRLFVDGREWTQVATLNDSAPTDHHYTVRMREDGTLTVLFGDGEHGRRLPTGGNNLRVRHRVGAGLEGNLAPGALLKLNKPHPLVSGLVQPLSATGGNDMEDVESLRENAPASVLTLERAVSLDDFAHLAVANASVWQARAFTRLSQGGRSERIEVVVVPAGGGALNGLGEQIRNTLASHALPGVNVRVSGYRAVIPAIEVEVAVDPSAYQPEVVVDRVREVLLERFALVNRTLGAPLFRGALFEAVEAVAGVENSTCRILDGAFLDLHGAPAAPRRVVTGADGAVRRVSVEPDQVIYLDAETALPVITAVNYSL